VVLLSARIPTAIVVGALAIGIVVDITLRWRAVNGATPTAAFVAPNPGPPAPPEIPSRGPVVAPPSLDEGAAGSPVVLVDGMTKRDNGIDGPGLEGYWYTYSDGTGEVFPAPGSPHLEATEFGGRRAREVSGRGQDNWGVGFGFELSRAGTTVQKTTAHAFDARAYAGIQFDIFSKSSPVRLRVSFGDADTDPRGGVCQRNSTLSNTACSGDFGEELDVAQGTWATRRVPFSQTAIPSWSKLQSAIDHGLRKDAIYSVHFSLRPDQAKIPPFDVLVANVFFFL
jgi:hypothetical protein